MSKYIGMREQNVVLSAGERALAAAVKTIGGDGCETRLQGQLKTHHESLTTRDLVEDLISIFKVT